MTDASRAPAGSRLGRALSSSRLVRAARRVRAGDSVVNAWFRDRSGRVRAWVEGSRVARIASVDGDGVVESSLVGSVAGRVRAWILGSYLYRWLTAEPEPGVIVIDLRETWTVAPVIMFLDWVMAWVVGGLSGSRFVRGSRAVSDAFADAPARVVGIVVVSMSATAVVLGVVGSSVTAWGVVWWLVVATIGLLGVRDSRSLPELRETWWYGVLVAVFEPPEPPDGNGK